MSRIRRETANRSWGSIITLGRPRNEETTQRILEGALQQLLAGGYSALNVEALAAAVKTSRTAIYRRWPDRAELAMAAIELVAKVGEPCLSGTVEENLTEHTMQNDKNQAASEQAHAPQGAWSAILNPNLLSLFMKRIGRHRRENGREIIALAVAKGELPTDVDGDLILDTLAGFTLFRNAVAGREVLRDDVLTLTRSLCAVPPRKTAH